VVLDLDVTGLVIMKGVGSSPSWDIWIVSVVMGMKGKEYVVLTTVVLVVIPVGHGSTQVAVKAVVTTTSVEIGGELDGKADKGDQDGWSFLAGCVNKP